MRSPTLFRVLLLWAVGALLPAPAQAKARVFVRRVFDLEAVVTKVVVSEAWGDSDINLQLRPVDPTVDTGWLHSSVTGRAQQSVPRFLYESWHPHTGDSGGKTWPEHLADFLGSGIRTGVTSIRSFRSTRLVRPCWWGSVLPAGEPPAGETPPAQFAGQPGGRRPIPRDPLPAAWPLTMSVNLGGLTRSAAQR